MTKIKFIVFTVAAFGYVVAGIKIVPKLEGSDSMITAMAFAIAALSMIDGLLGDSK